MSLTLAEIEAVEDCVLTGELRALGDEINAVNRSNGWKDCKPEDWSEQEYKIPAVIALVHSEVSEALEAYRHGDRTNFLEEMADTVIRCFDVTNGLGMDLGRAVLAKLEKNRHRGFRHGNKAI
jgi:NTP pyrophosphatase (non-canonical NTP hydrolase)